MRPTTKSVPAKAELNRQAFTAFSATRVDDSAAAAGFHAYQKAVRAGAASFRRLVSAFHSHGTNPFLVHTRAAKQRFKGRTDLLRQK